MDGPLPNTRFWPCLNEIYLGHGNYGVATAALDYFDKALDQLELHEMAYLAALPKTPSNYHPVRRTTAIGRRIGFWSDEENGYVSAEQAELAVQPLDVQQTSGSDNADAPYFTEEVRRILLMFMAVRSFMRAACRCAQP